MGHPIAFSTPSYLRAFVPDSKNSARLQDARCFLGIVEVTTLRADFLVILVPLPGQQDDAVVAGEVDGVGDGDPPVGDLHVAGAVDGGDARLDVGDDRVEVAPRERNRDRADALQPRDRPGEGEAGVTGLID